MKLNAPRLALLSLFSAAPLVAAPVTINNFSFEDPDVADTFNSGQVTSWLDSGTNAGVEDAVDAQFPGTTGNVSPLPGTAQGDQYAFINGSGFLAQDIGLLAPNTVYTLTIALGDRLNQANTAAILEFRNGIDQTGTLLLAGTTAAPTANTFADRSLQFTSGASVSGDLTIVIRHTGVGSSAIIDNVRLDASPIPEPSAGLVLLGGAGALGLLRRRRS